MAIVRPAMSQYEFFNFKPPLRNIVGTSLPYIFVSPLVPVVGTILAFGCREHKSRELKILLVSFVLSLILLVFDLWFNINLFEGVSFCG